MSSPNFQGIIRAFTDAAQAYKFKEGLGYMVALSWTVPVSTVTTVMCSKHEISPELEPTSHKPPSNDHRHSLDLC